MFINNLAALLLRLILLTYIYIYIYILIVEYRFLTRDELKGNIFVTIVTAAASMIQQLG